MKGIGTCVAALIAVVFALGCEQSHTRGNSSGSNWLTCETLADCDAAEEAVICDADGFCVDDDGERIAAESAPAQPDSGMPSDPPEDAGPSGPVDAGALCAWGVDDMLAAAGAEAPGRANCGQYNGSDALVLAGALACFDAAVERGEAVEFTINRCVDCSIPTVYVANAGGELFAVYMENDNFGDELREAKVESCEAIVLGSDPQGMPVLVSDIFCSNPVELYACTEPIEIERTAPAPAPVTPFKFSDVWLGDASNAVLHLYVSNQSFEEPLVRIDVSIDSTYVVTGDFAVEGQHNWYQFDIIVPTGALELSAVTTGGDTQLNETIDVPAERWAVLDYWYHPDDADGRRFTFTLSDMPVSFD